MLVLFLTLVPAALAAQERPGRTERMGRRHQTAATRLLERRAELGLTDEQVARIEELTRAVTENRAALRAEMQALRGSDTRAELTDEQRARLRELRQNMMRSERALRQGIQSTLTDEQKAKLRTRVRERRKVRGGGL